ncbi:hypothetical protein PVAP13_7KG122471 [Panicum virgatum]|uniref:Uncharacterized protein n=1 Tax=Panicum virgatum TaxID=38727 RepID=A0A8T0QEF7_PANVG|nr:hypothetical protein PVAP13_7KG122471 [Panicum virgatum]
MSSEATPPGAAPAGASSRQRRRPGRTCMGGAPRPWVLELAPPPAPRPTTRQEGRDGERGACLVDQAPLGRPAGRLAPRQLRAQAPPGVRLHPRACHHQDLSQVKELSHAQAASSSSYTRPQHPPSHSPTPPPPIASARPEFHHARPFASISSFRIRGSFGLSAGCFVVLVPPTAGRRIQRWQQLNQIAVFDASITCVL